MPEFTALAEASPEEWWEGFEINTRGAFNCTRALLSSAAANAILVEISTGPVHMPAMAQGSAYIASKLAATKIYETFAAENEDIEVVHIHPGVIYSELNVKSGIMAADDGEHLCNPSWLTPRLTTFSRPPCKLHRMGLQS